MEARFNDFESAGYNYRFSHDDNIYAIELWPNKTGHDKMKDIEMHTFTNYNNCMYQVFLDAEDFIIKNNKWH
jgi:hypothetical protein